MWEEWGGDHHPVTPLLVGNPSVACVSVILAKGGWGYSSLMSSQKKSPASHEEKKAIIAFFPHRRSLASLAFGRRDKAGPVLLQCAAHPHPFQTQPLCFSSVVAGLRNS